MSTNRTGGPDPLEKIFELAGRREPVHPERAAQIEEATRQRWQTMLARRRAAQRRRRIAWIGGGAMVAASVVAVAVFMSRIVTEAPVVATVIQVVGTPETGARGHAMAIIRTGTELRAGSVLETAGDDGVALQLVGGHDLRLAVSSRIRIEADAVVLDAGAVYLDSDDNGHGTAIELRSRVGTVRELGTQYMAALAGDVLEVSVREGAVRVAQGDVVATAHAGELLQLDASGHTRKLDVPRHGEYWSWVTQLAPVPAIEGLTLAEFLRWLTREQGWQLEFASPELILRAGKVVLSGSIDGMNGEEALAAVMTSTGWRYTLADGALTIESRGDEHR